MKVLVVRFSSIGDIVLTSPVVRGLKRQTGAEVHFLTKRSFATTVDHNPYIDKVWTIERRLSEIAEGLVAEDFTHLVDLHGNLRTVELKQRLRIGGLQRGRRPIRIATFDKLNVRKFLLTRFGIDRMPQVHIVDRYLATVRGLGVVNDGEGLDYFIGADEGVARPYPSYLAFVIGAAHATKRLEEAQMVEICERIDHPVVLLGGPAEREMGERIAKQAGVFNGCGRYSLNGSADLVRQARVVISHDTGLMHIAAAYRRPIVSVWGNTVPAFGMYPYLPAGDPAATVAEVGGLGCRPCSKIGYASCPKGHFRCMRDQELAVIARAALREIEA